MICFRECVNDMLKVEIQLEKSITAMKDQNI